MFDRWSFMPHGMCFDWRPDVLSLHVVSDALIALAYFSIPFVLVYLVRRRPDLPFLNVFRMFSAFIVACGLTHVLAIVVIWYPYYWFEGYVKAATASLSVLTALMLFPMLPRILALRTPEELLRVNEQLQGAVAEGEHLLRKYEREHYVATMLQTASLAELPQRLSDLEISTVYRPANGDLEIGGDWYDAFELDDGRIVFSIGDVAGKGLGASILMGKMRQAIRVAAQVQVTPGAILDAADRALRLESLEQFVTAFVGIYDNTERILWYANAGHPAPLIRSAQAVLTELHDGGLPLGLRVPEDAESNFSVHLDDNSTIFMYTDGLSESTHDYGEGELRIRTALRSPESVRAKDIARYMHDTILFDGVTDDVAIMAVRVCRERGQMFNVRFGVDDAAAAAAARGEIARLLRVRGATEDNVFDAEVIFSELIGNVSRHAGGTVDVRLDVRKVLPVLHVLDDGRGFQYLARLPADAFDESGRGLFIVKQLSETFTIARRPGSGSHARVVLRCVAPSKEHRKAGSQRQASLQN